MSPDDLYLTMFHPRCMGGAFIDQFNLTFRGEWISLNQSSKVTELEEIKREEKKSDGT